MSFDGKDPLRIAVLGALAETVRTEADRVRGEAAPQFAALKEQGFPHQKVPCPAGGAPLGRLEFTGGTPGVTVDDAKVLAYAREHESRAAVEDYVDPLAVTRAEVVALIKDKFPELVRQRVRKSIYDRLAAEAKGNAGRILHPDGSGEFTVVGDAYTTPVEGKVRWCPAKDATSRIMAGLASGTIGDLGLWPLAITAAVAPAPEPVPSAVTITPEPAPRKLRFGGQEYDEVPLFDDEDLPELARDPEPEPWPPAVYYDDDGFLTPVHAATHVIFVQGGFSTAEIEAYRMVADGGVSAERARVWLRSEGLPEQKASAA